ncbi:hypothetical protein Pint_23694 [Pistacia integerrima]|uniref:Uncharacterized protein n=1 Tax=Pistacia integerrima TaxID=434235 RepID=A0ACC0YN98_9ROSI|nr:hypothetical protein Pint_23694 [Pistacia integerrima]
MPLTTSVLSAYTAFTASAMLAFPEILLLKETLIIDECNGYSINQLYELASVYLRTKITASLERLKVSKTPKDKKLSVTINKGEKIIDIFEVTPAEIAEDLMRSEDVDVALEGVVKFLQMKKIQVGARGSQEGKLR